MKINRLIVPVAYADLFLAAEIYISDSFVRASETGSDLLRTAKNGVLSCAQIEL